MPGAESKTSGHPSLRTLIITSIPSLGTRHSFSLLNPCPHLHAAGETLLALGLALHLLADLDVDLEELAHAAVEADGLALVQVGFAVRCVDAFCGAGLEETARKTLVKGCR